MKMCLEVRHVRFKDNKITIKKKEAKREGERKEQDQRNLDKYLLL